MFPAKLPFITVGQFISMPTMFKNTHFPESSLTLDKSIVAHLIGEIVAIILILGVLFLLMMLEFFHSLISYL